MTRIDCLYGSCEGQYVGWAIDIENGNGRAYTTRRVPVKPILPPDTSHRMQGEVKPDDVFELF